MKLFRLLALPTILAFTCYNVSAQNSDKIAVSVNVGITDDQTLHDRVVSAINRELRTLGDVTVVPDGYFASYAFDVVGFVTESQAGVRTGFALAVNFSSLVPMWAIKAQCKEGKLAGLTVPSLLRVPDSPINAKVHLNTLINVGGPDEVEKDVRDIVATFDTTVLMPERQLEQKLQASSQSAAQRNSPNPAITR